MLFWRIFFYSMQQLICLPFPSWRKELVNFDKIPGVGTLTWNSFALPIKVVELWFRNTTEYITEINTGISIHSIQINTGKQKCREQNPPHPPFQPWNICIVISCWITLTVHACAKKNYAQKDKRTKTSHQQPGCMTNPEATMITPNLKPQPLEELNEVEQRV